jgi:uncharacterized protein DUF1801
LKATDNYFENQPEPYRGFLLALRSFLLKDPQLSESLKYGMPVYSYKGRMLCYLWIHKKLKQPYLLVVDGKLIDDPLLLQEKRSRMKIFLMDINKNIPLKTIDQLIKKMKKLRDE